MTHQTLLKTVGVAALLSLSAGMAAQAQTIITTANGIIRNSLCVGADCQSGISFVDSTIIVKENNTRIKFADSSTAASFPRNDWELEANSQTNGGPNRFSLFDCGEGANDGGCGGPVANVFSVEAGAGSNALYVDDGGRVGFGTGAPVVELHVVDGDTPTLRLAQDTSSGFAAQTWDLAGNETNFFLRDVTNGSALPFRVRPGAPSSSIDVAADGDVFIGLANNATNAGDLVVGGTGTKRMDLVSTNDGATQMRMVSASNNRRIVARDADGGTADVQMQFTSDALIILGAADTWATISAAGIVTTGAGDCNPGPCDGVFDPAVYEVESIEDHAAFMWDNKYLWGVGPTPEGAPINLSQKTTGILHELEKAHIYIEQLNGRISNLEARLENSVQ